MSLIEIRMDSYNTG